MPTIKFNELKEWLDNRYIFKFNNVGLDYEYAPTGSDNWKTLNEFNLQVELFTEGFTGFDKQLTALMKSDYVTHFDPIKQYFDSLPEWNKETDYISELASYVWTTDDAFFRTQFKKALVRMAAQGLGMLDFNKHCLTFFGKQNDGKSSFLRNLCPPALAAYLKDNPDFEGKDSKRALAENFILNIDELQGMSKTDINRVKAMFSESKIKVRLPYDRKDSIMDRRASFVASTNEREFLVDSTGNVRWLVFQVLGIKHDNGGPEGYMSIDINKVWAQAYYLLKTGFAYKLTKEEVEYSEKNNEQYAKDSTEYELLISHFEKGFKDEDSFYQSTDIMRLLQNLYGNQVRISKEAIGKALHKMKIEKEQHRKQGMTFPVYGYWLKPLVPSMVPLPAGVADEKKPIF